MVGNRTHAVNRDPRSGHTDIPHYVCCVDNCKHSVGNVPIDLNPCAFYHECFEHPNGVDEQANFLFEGVLHGFKIVDESSEIESYVRSNYTSVTHGSFRDQMSRNIIEEEHRGRVSKVDVRPHCVHAIGGVRKKDGSLRPITDCKRPIGHSVNNFMNTTVVQFRFKTLDYVANIITKNCYLAVVDISKAYRSVHIYPPPS